MPDQGDLERRLVEQSQYFLSEVVLIGQIGQFHQTALQCVREYQDILIQLGAARAKRQYAWAVIDTGALALSLVLTCGGALVAKGVLRGQGLYARMVMSPLARAQAAGRSFQYIKQVQTAVAAMPKTLVPPAFLIRTIYELPVRLVIGGTRTALASAFLGPIVVGGKILCQETNPLGGLIQGKFGVMRTAVEHAGAGSFDVHVSEEGVLRSLQDLVRRMDPIEGALSTMDPHDRVTYVAELHHQAEQSVRNEPKLAKASEEDRLYLTSSALMDYWYGLMVKAQQSMASHNAAAQQSQARIAELERMLGR